MESKQRHEYKTVKEGYTMRTHKGVAASFVVLAPLVLLTCGNPTIQIGKTISGTLTDKSKLYVAHDPYDNSVTGMYYCDDYQIEVQEGVTYLVTIWSNKEAINFEDLENGRFTYTDGSGVSGSSFGNYTPSNQTAEATWVPSQSGAYNVDVYTSYDYVPIDYTFTIHEY
jgi:hypothetical protein